MELKEMADTGVVVNNEKERMEYLTLCEEAGWRWVVGGELPTEWRATHLSFPYCISAKRAICNSHYGAYGNTITLAQFKERNGIMKYQEGQILVRSGCERKVLGAHSNLFHMSVNGDFTSAGRDYTEQELNDQGYTLKTDEPELVEITAKDALAELAKLKGIPVETLRIKD